MNDTVLPISEQEIRAWTWSRESVKDIMPLLKAMDFYLFDKFGEWLETVPLALRGRVCSVLSSSALNSEEEVHCYAEILAVDNEGYALVCRGFYNTYTDDQHESIDAMSLDDAMQLIEVHRLDDYE